MIVPHHRHRGPRGRRLAVIVSLLVVLAGAAAYYGRTRPASVPPPPAKQQAGQVQSYTVRGRILDLPDPSRPSSGLEIHHEEIKNFARKDGTLGMSSMSMDFPYPETVTFEGLAIGDEVEFTLEVNWGGFPLYQLTKISKLPADTVLEFDSAEGK